jgi:ribosomal protein S18 acetylase RimI-like enzyme
MINSAYQIVTPSTDQDFERYFQLRWEVLRKPWNRPKGTEQDDLEHSCIHKMVLSGNDRVVACGRLQFSNDVEGQIRYMAVDRNFQGKGLGSIVLKELEAIAKEKGRKYMVLQARENALLFYKSQGYHEIEKSYLLFGIIQHYLMRKEL